jgi:hypothetical protein
MTAREFAVWRLEGTSQNQPAIRDAVSGETPFHITGENPLYGDQPLYVQVSVDGREQVLARITNFVIVGRAVMEVVEMPLTHGDYDGASYSTGQATIGDQRLHYVVVERGGGSDPQMDAIFKPLP